MAYRDFTRAELSATDARNFIKLAFNGYACFAVPMVCFLSESDRFDDYTVKTILNGFSIMFTDKIRAPFSIVPDVESFLVSNGLESYRFEPRTMKQAIERMTKEDAQRARL